MTSGRLKGDIRRRQREREQDANEERERQTVYWREPGGRLVSFDRGWWSSADIAEHKNKVWAAYNAKKEQEPKPEVTAPVLEKEPIVPFDTHKEDASLFSTEVQLYLIILVVMIIISGLAVRLLGIV
jgi:hypothetical protein